MADIDDEDRALLIVDLVERSVIADADSPDVAPRELLAPGWARILGKRTDSS